MVEVKVVLWWVLGGRRKRILFGGGVKRDWGREGEEVRAKGRGAKGRAMMARSHGIRVVRLERL